MAYHIQSGFGAGELDPALHERTTFDKYKAGLKTLRNAYVGKTGRIISRPGSRYWKATKTPVLTTNTFTADAGTDLLTVTAHPYRKGDKVRVSSTGTLPAGLTAATDYYVFLVDTSSFTINTFYLATSLANALAGTAIDITSAGAGTHTITPVTTDRECMIYCPPYQPYVIEWGHGYVRIHNIDTGVTATEAAHRIGVLDFPKISFVASGLYIYIFCENFWLHKMVLGDLNGSDPFLDTRFLTSSEVVYYTLTAAPPTVTSSTFNGTGSNVNYAFTQVIDGQESPYAYFGTYCTGQKPLIVGEYNIFNLTVNSAATEIRAYRRPENGGEFGYIGSKIKTTSTTASIEDWGEDADYTHLPPIAVDRTGPLDLTNAYGLKADAGVVYQQRLVVVPRYGTSQYLRGEIMYASRTGYHTNFLRDFPYSNDSALVFKTGSGGLAKILAIIDNGGLLVFTTVGIFQGVGALTPTNLSLEKRGNWVIDLIVPPLEIPGGVLFVDKSTNSIRSLMFSTEGSSYIGEELSIYSSHLLLNKRIVSWAFQEGDTPLLWAVLDNGECLSLSYNREHQMQSWAHHDGDGLFERVTVLTRPNVKSIVYFVINRSGTRSIEYLSDRFVADQKDQICLDSSVTFKTDIALNSAATVIVTANTPGDWEGLLTLTSNVAIFANTTDNGAVGSVFRFFDSEGSAVDLTVTTYTSTTVVVVQPSALFPSAEASVTKLYKTYSSLTGLSHLNGKSVSLLVDGYVEGSPNNDIDNYTALTVSGGSLTIPNSRRGAIIQVGLPYTSDIETLDIDTVEQKPTLLESQLVHKVYLKVYNSRGLYVGSKFPDNDKVEGLTDPETRTEDIELGNIGNAAQALTTKRLEVVIPNDWKSSGRIVIRQVDPLPFEILSIIPDLSILI